MIEHVASYMAASNSSQRESTLELNFSKDGFGGTGIISQGDLMILTVSADGHGNNFTLELTDPYFDNLFTRVARFNTLYTHTAIYVAEAGYWDNAGTIEARILEKGSPSRANSFAMTLQGFKGASKDDVTVLVNETANVLPAFTEYAPYTALYLQGNHVKTLSETNLERPSLFSKILTPYWSTTAYLTLNYSYRTMLNGGTIPRWVPSKAVQGPFSALIILREKPNVAPVRPTISIDNYKPEYIGGESVTVRASGGLDPEGEPVTYHFEYSNGSGSWVGLGSSTNGVKSMTLADVAVTNAQFRVRTMDPKGAYSPYAVSDKFSVRKSNRAPAPPTNIHHDAGTLIQAGRDVTVYFTSGVDPDGDIVNHEVQFGYGDNWRTIHNGATRPEEVGYTVSIGEEFWPQAYFRVRAYDQEPLSSAWAHSSGFMVNTAPPAPATLTHNAGAMVYGETRIQVVASPVTTNDGGGVRYEFEFWDGSEWVPQGIQSSNILGMVVPDDNYESVWFRVRALDDFSGVSDWRISAPFEIRKNFFPLSDIRLPRPDHPENRVNVEYLREKTNELRVMNGMSNKSWSDRIIFPFELPIKAIHMNELQEAILEVYADREITHPDPTVEEMLNEVVLARDEQFLINEDLLDRYQNMIRALQNI